MKTKSVLSLFLAFILFSACSVVRPGEVGVKQRLGKLNEKTIDEGMVFYFPLTTKVVKASTQTNNLKLFLNLPSKEGLSVKSEISVLYRIIPDSIQSILRTYGQDYEAIIGSIFRSASSDVCAQYYAKDMHSGMRASIEKSIKVKMVELLDSSGIVIESILMKSIQLPDGLARAIELKLEAEQDAMRMEFVLKQEKLEAERKIIEAEGTRDAQKIVAEGLTEEILKLKSIEAFVELSQSENAKVIITDGTTPMLVD
ncbi:prohibitin family protein [bacterium]|nr:prohibitin family protein [bacterium]